MDLPSNPTRLCITGASGFIGWRLAQLAAADGHPVTALAAVNNPVEQNRCDTLTAAGVPVVIAPLDDRARIEQALRDQDVIVHLAAAQHEAHQPESYFHRVNVDGTRTLLELAAKSGVKRFVYGSTIGVYGSLAHGVLDETSPLAPDNPYGRTKAAAEAVVREFSSTLPVVIARISETYGPGDMRLLKLFRALQRGRYVTLGNGANHHQLVYVDDLARGLLAAARAKDAVGATFVLAGAQSVTTDEMAAAIAAAVNQPGAIRHVPLWPFAIAAVAMEKTFSPLGLRPPLHRRRLDFFRKSFRFSTAAADRLLGFRAEIPFAEGARRTAQWYREQRLLG
ncbi:MAG TPA: NAD(P)-dependent oxidoreductase [Steroidobacteraceae bacterium]|nr:NAD(P)-dependent oxidoreductase [Steroidobacteraceae bacterium]